MTAPFDDPEASRKLPTDVIAYVAEVEARLAKANLGPIDVHRYDNDGGSIAYQLQQSGRGEDSVVLCAFDDDDNPKARHDAEFTARAWTDVPALIAIVREQAANAVNWQRASGCANPDTLAVVIADFYQRAECRPPLDGIPDGIDRIKAERAALRERLAKLETLLVRAHKHLVDEGVAEDCECRGCVLCQDLAKELPT